MQVWQLLLIIAIAVILIGWFKAGIVRDVSNEIKDLLDQYFGGGGAQ